METRKRIIPKIEIKNGFVVKGIELEGVKKVGEPIEIAQEFYEQHCDELILSDLVASLYNRIEIDKIIHDISQEIFIPISAGGGIKSISDAEKLFKSGADKVFLNTSAVENPGILEALLSNYGSSSIVLQVDTSFYRGGFKIFTKSGREFHDIQLEQWLDFCQELGVGEIFVTSIRHDGRLKGPDRRLLELLKDRLSVPVIYSGGVCSVTDLAEILSHEVISGVTISSALYSNLIRIDNARADLIAQGVNLRKI